MYNPTPQSRGFATPSTATATVAPPAQLLQMEGESDRAFAAFIAYCEMGAGRTLRKLHERFVEQSASNVQAIRKHGEPPTTELSTIFGWSSRNDWQNRVRYFDRVELAAHAEERARIRRERQERIETDEWERGARLKKMADEILAQSGQFLHSITRTIQGEVVDGVRVDTKIVTIRLKAETAIKAAELGQKTQRIAAGMPTSTVRSEVDVKNMSDAQLYEYLVQLAHEEQEARNDPSLEAHDPDLMDD